MKKILSFSLVLTMLLSFSLPAMAAGASGFGGLLDNFQQASPGQEESIINEAPDAETVLEEARNGKSKTVMIYMCGSNLESMPQSSATRDVREMIASGFATEDINVIIMPGGSKHWHIPEFETENTGIYSVRPDGITKLWEADQRLNMGDPKTLTQLLQYSADNFPAEQFGLILWDHGGGALGGFCHDEITGKLLTTKDLEKAILDTSLADRGLEWIGFDACLMGSAELAVVLAPYTKYLVASEETEPGYGWDYSFLKGLEKDSSGADTGSRIVDHYIDWYLANSSAKEITLSCIDLSMAEEFERRVDSFFADAAKLVSKDNYADLSRAVRNAKAFGNVDENAVGDGNLGASARVYDLIDLGGLIDVLDTFLNADAKELRDFVDQNMIVKSRGGEDENICGLTMYHPLRAKNSFSSYISTYHSLDVFPSYTAYIENFGKILCDTPAASFSNLLASFRDSGKVQHSLFSLPLTEAQQENLADAELIVLQQSAENEDAWHLVSVSDDVYIDDTGSVNGGFVFRNLFLTDENGNPVEGTAPLYYQLGTNGEILVPVTLCGTDPITGEEMEVSAWLVCTEENDSLTVTDISVYDEISGYYSARSQIDLSFLERIRFDCIDREVTRNEDGAICAFEDWTVVNTTSCYWEADEPGQLRFIEDSLDESSLYAAFSLTDVQSNHYTSELTGFAGALDEGVLRYTYDDKDQLVSVNQLSCVLDEEKTLYVTLRLSNISEQEIIVGISGITVNGKTVEGEVFGYGMGPNGGLLPEEEQSLFLPLGSKELEGFETINSMTLPLSVYDAETDELVGTVPVEAELNLSMK